MKSLIFWSSGLCWSFLPSLTFSAFGGLGWVFLSKDQSLMIEIMENWVVSNNQMSKLISESKSPVYSTVINHQFDFADNVFGCNKFVNNVFNTGKVRNSLTLRTLPSLRRTRLSFHYLGGTREVDAIPTSMKVMIKTFLENWDSKAPSVGTLLAYLETTA